MKKQKRIIALIIVFVMLFSNTAFAVEYETDGAQGAKALKEHIESMEQAEEEFMASEEVIKNNKANETYQNLIVHIREDEKYASFYGGAYINEENELVVIMTNQSEENIQLIKDAAGNNDFVIQYGTVTLEKLKELQNKYNQKIEQWINAVQPTEQENILFESIVGISLDQSTSELVVNMYELSDEKIKVFKSVFGNDENIRFENSMGSSLTSSWYTGNKIYVSGKGYLTTGYRAYYINGAGERKNGFVTAGHGCAIGNTVYGVRSDGNIVLGTCLLSMFTGGIDAAFVAITNSDYEMTNTFNSGLASGSVLDTSVATDDDLAEGTYVYSFGVVSGMQVGRILDNSANFIYTDEDTGKKYYLVNLVSMSNTTVGGDSGGCVCMIKNGGYTIAGTIVGYQSYFGAVDCYFSKAHNQISNFEIVKY